MVFNCPVHEFIQHLDRIIIRFFLDFKVVLKNLLDTSTESCSFLCWRCRQITPRKKRIATWRIYFLHLTRISWLRLRVHLTGAKEGILCWCLIRHLAHQGPLQRLVKYSLRQEEYPSLLLLPLLKLSFK